MIDLENFRKAQLGDRNAIEMICRETWEPVYRYIYFKVQNREEAEDITQETFARAIGCKKTAFLKPEKYIGFLRTVALNIIRDRWRKNKKFGRLIDFDALSPSETEAEDHAEADTLRVFVERALKTLPEDHRKVIELRIIKGYSAAETGEMLGKKEGTVRQIQYRALRALAEKLKNE